MTQKRIKGSTLVLVLVGAMLAVSLVFNAIGMLTAVIEDANAGGRKKRAEVVVADLDAMQAAGGLDQFDLSMAGIVGKPRMWSMREIDGVKHQLVIVGTEDWYVELYALRPDGAEVFEGRVYAAHHVWVGCCSDGGDRWWVSDAGLLETYMSGE